MSGFVASFGVLVGALQIILFFKLWKACDSINKLADHFVGVEQLDVSLNNRIVAGDDSVESSIRKRLARDIDKLCKQSRGVTGEDFILFYGKSPEEAISELKGEYKILFDKLKKPLPSELSKLRTIEDLWDWESN